MIDLYHGDGTRSQRVRWVMEELGVAYRLHPLPFPPRVRQPAFLEINPIGSLPYFVDGDVRMTESMGICQYLLATYGPSDLAVSPGEPGFADYLQFCWYGEATMMPPVGTLVRWLIMEPPERRAPEPIAEARAVLAGKVEAVARALATSDYMAAGRFTLADVSVSYTLGLATLLGEGSAFPEAVAAYRERLMRRPAHVRAHASTGDQPS